MPDALGDARWAAIRAICEGALPTHERTALACGVYVKSISRRAGKEGWKMLDFRRPRVRTAHREMIDLAARAAAGEELDPVDTRDCALAADDGSGAEVEPGVLVGSRGGGGVGHGGGNARGAGWLRGQKGSGPVTSMSKVSPSAIMRGT